MKIKFPYYSFSVWISGITDIVEGICKIVSLGFWLPDLTLKILCWGLEKDYEKR
jgi:hypothetical protein